MRIHITLPLSDINYYILFLCRKIGCANNYKEQNETGDIPRGGGVGGGRETRGKKEKN